MSRSRRIQALESKQACDSVIRTTTVEERHIAAYEFWQAVGKSDRPQNIIHQANLMAEKAATAIRVQATKHDTQQFQEHLNSYVRIVWSSSGRSTPFVLPIVGSEYDDWWLPDLYRRRLGARARSSVIALLGTPPRSRLG